jgi:hypothetical protein
MSIAGLLKQVTNGMQDERLEPPRGQPRLADVRSVFRPAGRFTTKLHRLDFERPPAFGQRATVEIPRKGHLVTRLWLVVTLPDIRAPQIAARAAAGENFAGPSFNWTNSIGHALIEDLTMEIGGSRVEQMDGRLLEVLDEFNTPLEKITVKNNLIGRNMTNYSETGLVDDAEAAGGKRVIVELPFWFARGDCPSALPVDAINADMIRVGVGFRGVSGSYYTDSRLITRTDTDPCLVGGGTLWQIAESSFYMSNPGGSPVDGLWNDGFPVSDNVYEVPGLKMPPLALGDTYMLAEYVYLDKPEANRFRLADLQIPIVQHYALPVVATLGAPRVAIPLTVPNPVRALYFMGQRVEAQALNAWFLATRELQDTRTKNTQMAQIPYNNAPWWPDASPLRQTSFSFSVPAFRFRDSEPFRAGAIVYEGGLVRARTEAMQMWRSIGPSLECVKSPYVNRYMYMVPFSVLSEGKQPSSAPIGEANYDRILKRWLHLDLAPFAGSIDPNQVPNLNVYVWAETFNILRIYGGRAGTMFSY